MMLSIIYQTGPRQQCLWAAFVLCELALRPGQTCFPMSLRAVCPKRAGWQRFWREASMMGLQAAAGHAGRRLWHKQVNSTPAAPQSPGPQLAAKLAATAAAAAVVHQSGRPSMGHPLPKCPVRHAEGLAYISSLRFSRQILQQPTQRADQFSQFTSNACVGHSAQAPLRQHR